MASSREADGLFTDKSITSLVKGTLLVAVVVLCLLVSCGRRGRDEVLFVVLINVSAPRFCSISWLPRRGISLQMKSLLNTVLNSVHLNFDMMFLNSNEKGGPFKILMRDETSVSMKNELRKDA